MFTIARERCTGCAACVSACPVGAIRLTGREGGERAEIDQETCKQCGACVEVCPERAILAQSEPVEAREIVQVKARPVPAKPQSQQVRLGRPAPKALIWLGPALAFVGREIVPRLAASLLDAWDRRTGRPASPANDLAPGRSARQPTANRSQGGGQRHRRRRRGA